MPEHTEPTQALIASYEQQQPLFKRIEAAQGLQMYVTSQWDMVRRAFPQTGPRELGCMDEGVTDAQAHTAGSGILLGLDAATATFNNAGLTGIRSHENCGAANLHAQAIGRAQDADILAREFSQQLAIRLGVPYLGHTTAKSMNRPATGHDARVVYVDTTGRFNYDSSLVALPKGFQISAGGLLTPDQTVSDVKLAIEIILGGHGLGSIISPQNPIWVVPLGTSDSIGQTLGNLDTVVKQYPRIATLKPVIVPNL